MPPHARPSKTIRWLSAWAAGAVLGLLGRVAVSQAMPAESEVTASSTSADSSPKGALDHDRFSVSPGSLWRGGAGQGAWWWQVNFRKPRSIGAILQIHGDDPLNLRNAPEHYVWQFSHDGTSWQDWNETAVSRERRLFRIHRLRKTHQVRYVRLVVFRCVGSAPSLREVEFYAEPAATIEFPDWVAIVNTGEEGSRLPSPQGFVDLVRGCPGWDRTQFQHVPHGQFDEKFLSIEPHPLCALLTGSTLDWCQLKREPWRGVEQVLKNRNLPMWGACGGAQILAILDETGVDKPWDCPRCRDPRNPKLPIYTHIGHTGQTPCGVYTKNVWERGRYEVKIVARDPVFQAVPNPFPVIESHVGQIAYVPKGWVRVVTKGPQGLTENQCLRVVDRYIYAAQFHIEAPGTPETSRLVMSNFLAAAKRWGGYNPRGQPVPPPEPIAP